MQRIFFVLPGAFILQRMGEWNSGFEGSVLPLLGGDLRRGACPRETAEVHVAKQFRPTRV